MTRSLSLSRLPQGSRGTIAPAPWGTCARRAEGEVRSYPAIIRGIDGAASERKIGTAARRNPLFAGLFGRKGQDGRDLEMSRRGRSPGVRVGYA